MSYDVLCFQESWIPKNYDTTLLYLDSYTCIHQTHGNCSTKGGLIIYIKSKYDLNIMKTTDNSEACEGLFIEINGDGLKKQMIIGNIYRPPKPLISDHNQLIDELSITLQSIENSNSENILAGNYNIDLLKLNLKNEIAHFYDTLVAHHFRTDLSHITTELWEIPVLRMAH